jgi:hypothetical protein
MIVCILAYHLRQIEFLAPLPAHRHAYKPASILRHEIDIFTRGELGGADAVAFVFAVGIVCNENYLATPQRFKTIFYGIEMNVIHVNFSQV